MKILIITNEFVPPITGGNIRIYKMIKYFLRKNIDVYLICNNRNNILKVKNNIPYCNDLSGLKLYPVYDLPTKIRKLLRKNLASEIVKSNSKTYKKNKIKSFIEKYIIPDIYRYYWCRGATNKALEIIEKERIKIVLTSSPPHSTQLIGLNLKKKLSDCIYWICDMRDLWSMSPTFELGLSRRRTANMSKEKKVYNMADLILFVSKPIADKTIEVFGISKSKCEIVTNGYDEEDFLSIKRTIIKSPNDPFIFLFSGTIKGPRVKNSLIDGIIMAINIINNNNVCFNFIGEFEDGYLDKLKVLGDHYLLESRIPHGQALQRMLNSDVLILLLTDDQEGRIAYSGKFFEYLRAHRPILAIVPKGIVSDIVLKNNIGEVANPSSSYEICNKIIKMINNINNYNLEYDCSEFNRELITYNLVKNIEARLSKK